MGRNPLIIGVTGRIASGKDTVSKIISNKYGFYEINADKLGHSVLHEKKEEIVKIFGQKILNTKNEIDKLLLRNLVFNDNKELKKLESVSHPVILSKIKKILIQNQSTKIIINAALLFKMNLEKLCDYIIVLKAKNSIIKNRLSYSIPNIDSNMINKILKIQKDIFFEKNIINLKIINIINNKNYAYLEKEIEKKMQEIINYERFE
ncbi:dephospho-CoA kinase [Borreliella burgdorferi]|uniref:Dephospho-CoA kinase n=1 Tax=Borreliella burgdorferi (strain ZS7) TaxID=445985 RepID=A0A0H3C1Z6_BORBZ|nr:dephospho-CoA kinase [Borreliella burgdorferi]ACK74733.1 dephospho-CoA kinase [Borreliella burgdorferi ZS7]ADQ29678.1 dephospho-CoA kinase [Borreliella burgdorferi N40]EEC21964.1 dephospho-CoA kinase [Borreliella burgdorferi 156a]EEH31795.1 dephospho-CoA kinase [Borreliella burgdorferi Bol26]MCD2319996.1 dephospho-CoA kinase [Borreliella burgdorferi]